MTRLGKVMAALGIAGYVASLFYATLTCFLIIGVVLLLALLFYAYKYAKDKPFETPWKFFTAFILLGGMALFVARNYVYPDRQIFDNTRYHVLEHLGFSFEKKLSLVQSRYSDESLWDDKEGNVLLQRDSSGINIEVQNFYEPLYVCPAAKSGYFRLSNNLVNENVSKGFTIKKQGNLLFQLRIIPPADPQDPEEPCRYLVRTKETAAFDTSAFDKNINKGYPLWDILLKTPHWQPTEDLRILLGGSLLVRDSIKIGNRAYGTDESLGNTAPLRFFPQAGYYSLPNVMINDAVASDPDSQFHIQAQNNSLFYSGIGFSKTSVYKLELGNGNEVRLLFLLPKMQALRNEDEDNMLFITSSIDEVKYHNLKGGYLFNIFESPKNLNNVNATLRYRVGSSTQNMFFKIHNLYETQQQDSSVYRADVTIPVKSKNTENGLSWLLNFHDLRETNSLKLWHIDLFIGIFVLLIGLRLYFNNKSIASPFKALPKTGGVTPIEMALYVTIFSFSIVRLILVWRMSTFVPIENIDISRFFKLRNGFSVYMWTLFISIFFFLVLILARLCFNTKSFVRRIDKAISNTTGKLNVSKRGKWLLVFPCILVALLLLSKVLPETYARLLNIPIPVICYFIFDLLFLETAVDTRKDRDKKKYSGTERFIYHNGARILLWTITFAYLAYQDSGFSIIFLLYGVIHHLFGWLFFSDYGLQKRSGPWAVVTFLAIIILFNAFLYWQSEMIVSLFDRPFMWGVVVAVVCCLLSYLILRNRYFSKWKYWVLLVAIPVIFLSLTKYAWFAGWLQEHKSYLKYRAEIQQPGVGIEDLITKNRFQSSDITYILRSAHNQWFINLYNNNPPQHYFEIQPHFNQGSSYTTQTTDLVVTRYLLAEHPVIVIVLLMALLFLLPVIYSLSVNLKGRKVNYSVLGVFILVFSIAMFVCLSATNRIVFFGQDFPFLSLTSRIAILFPMLIFLIALLNSWNQKNHKLIDDIPHNRKLLFPAAILLMAVSGFWLLHAKNKEKGKSYFDINQLINRSSAKVNAINDEFTLFQYNLYNQDKAAMNLPVNKLVADYLQDSIQCKMFSRHASDSSDNFLKSLLVHFKDPTTNKLDPNEFIHMRKRNGYYDITLNRKYYFIPSFRERESKWRGNLLAAKTESKLGFLNGKRQMFNPVSWNNNYIPNIMDLPNKNMPELLRYKDMLSNITIMKFDPEWTDNGKALYIIKSSGGDDPKNKAIFQIINDTLTISGKAVYPAVRLLPGDLLVLKINKGPGGKAVINWNIVEENEKYLARNIWLNGSQNLFYPLGKEFMWSYNFANLVSEAWSKPRNSRYLNTNLDVSIDYDLTSKIYNIIDNENKSKWDLGENGRRMLLNFNEIDHAEKEKTENGTGLYLTGNKMVLNRNFRMRDTAGLAKAIENINARFHPVNASNIDLELKEIIDEVTEKKFDYSTVVLDGFGRIRTIFDYSRYNRADPNNLKSFNRYLSELYMQSSTSTEQDFWGNRSLLTIRPGPGSSFKPIAFTAITSKMKFDWEKLSIEGIAESKVLRKDPASGKERLAFYGGKSFKIEKEPYWNLDPHNLTDEGLKCGKYLVKSNNIFHSLIMLLGSQKETTLREICQNNKLELLFQEVKKNTPHDSLTFPVVLYNQHMLRLDPDRWLPAGNPDYFNNYNSVLAAGLSDNFGIVSAPQGKDKDYFNSYGTDSLFGGLYEADSSSSFIWSYPEYGTFYQADRGVPPYIRNGLIQPSLGSFPVKVTPLGMATMGMRLASLNRTPFITTLSPDSPLNKPYEFFNIDTEWDTLSFLNFYQKNVLRQLSEVIGPDGTAKDLQAKLAKYKAKGYFFYAKTGTINNESESTARGKHLLVVITNQRLEDPGNPLSVDRLKQLRFYVVYMSYHGINKEEFDIVNFAKIIGAVMDSELFDNYMKEGK